MPHTDLSIPALLRARAAEHGDATAYTFIDGALDGTGFAESLTWSQVYRRVAGRGRGTAPVRHDG